MNIRLPDPAFAKADRTSDAYLNPVTAREVRETTCRTRQAYDASDLSEECDEEIVQLLKDGDALEAGTLLMQRMEATIQRRITWSLS